MKLFNVFSDNALFQAESRLTLRGTATPGTNIFAKLSGHDASTHGKCVCGADGIFEVTIDTPKASFRKYEIIVTDGDKTIVLKNIVFGELWIATGQSNMQLEFDSIAAGNVFLESLKDLDIRAYAQEYGERIFSLYPEYETGGKWVSTLDGDSAKLVSVCASFFCKELLDYFSEIGREVPVGFLCLSWGGTPIYSWIPRDALNSDAVAYNYLNSRSLLTTDSNSLSSQHPATMFNRRMAPTIGIKARGVLWYQGEFDAYSEYKDHFYKHFLYLMTDIYKELYAFDKENFKIICSLIYPCEYTDYGDTWVGYINDAFVKAYVEHPETYILVPISDLPPMWNSHDNHPIHPTHKHLLGKRMGELALRNIYNKTGHATVSVMRSYHIEGNKIILTFDKTEKGLYTSDGLHVRGMYIAGKDKLYMPAECEIVSDCKLAVYHPYLEAPCYCLYGWSSKEPNLNLFSGDFPILPFATDSDSSDEIKIELKPFTNLEVMSRLEWFESRTSPADWFYRPVWRPLNGTDVCQDNAITMHTENYNISLSVGSDINPFGIYTTSCIANSLDLCNYKSLEVDINHLGELEFYVLINYENGSGIKLSSVFTHESAPEFNHYTVDLSHLCDNKISKMTFVFSVKNNRIMKHINIGRIYLCPCVK